MKGKYANLGTALLMVVLALLLWVAPSQVVGQKGNKPLNNGGDGDFTGNCGACAKKVGSDCSSQFAVGTPEYCECYQQQFASQCQAKFGCIDRPTADGACP